MLNSLNITQNSPLPLWKQIYNQIRQQISDGSLRIGEELPSMSSLSKTLRVSIVTVRSACQALIDDGFLRYEGKRLLVISTEERKQPTKALSADEVLQVLDEIDAVRRSHINDQVQNNDWALRVACAKLAAAAGYADRSAWTAALSLQKDSQYAAYLRGEEVSNAEMEHSEKSGRYFSL